MFLKSMEMFGFKSFADRTLIEFLPGVTIVVGPNGCGKSNVVDSIKWVLGEKQARNIRGETMEDVIFSGTDDRKPLSLAEVSLTIDNENKILDIESDTVTVARRVFRDGESEYLINKSPVRLKDIEKLFMDTGIGKSAYSVMEQGKMDLILSNRAEDRRYLFEEAAGISRYKMQKKESLRKLHDTGDNLERINDIIGEIEREKDFKSKQADKTKIYIQLKSEMVELDVKINIVKYRDFSRKQEKLQIDINKLKEQREATSARVSSISAENEKDDKRKNDIQLQLFEQEKKLHAYKIRLEDIDQKTERNRKLIEEQRLRKESIDLKIKERSVSLKSLIEEKAKNEESGVDIRRKISEDRGKLTELFETRKSKLDAIHKSRDKIEENKRAISDIEKRTREHRQELELVIKRLIDAIDKRKAELIDSETERQDVRNRINGIISEIESNLKKIIISLESSMTEDALVALRKIDINALASDIGKFESYEDGFRSILFDKAGIHAEKERLDTDISSNMKNVEILREDISSIEKYINDEQSRLENVNEMITRVEKDLSRNENERDWIEKHLQSLSHQIKDIEKQIENHKEEILRSEKTAETLASEIKEWEQRLIEFSERSSSLLGNINELTEKRTDLDSKIHERKNIFRNDEEELQKLQERISALDRNLVEMIFRKNTIEDTIWTEYEKKVSDTASMKIEESELPLFQEKIQGVKKKILDIGPINNLAIEEYKDLKKRFEYYISQRDDIEKARQDILSVIEDINKTSVDMFLSTFMEIQKNFSDVFKRLFEGGDASVSLADPENVLETGIEIMVRPPGKKLKNINLLSGGERALTAIALLFATYMVRPSPFCFLDEIDAPLDEENIGRFVKMMKEFARSTQFIIVTHNKKTMSIGESIYGVTMEEPGVSKVVSLKMEKADSMK